MKWSLPAFLNVWFVVLRKRLYSQFHQSFQASLVLVFPYFRFRRLLINNAVGTFSGRDGRDLFGEWQSRERDRDEEDNEQDAPSIGMRGSMLCWK